MYRARAGPGACISPSGDGFTRLRVRRPGTYTLRARLDVAALLGDTDRGCQAGG